MQYPEIQFYRGSLVRLASGQLKQVEDLSSDDFLESVRLIQRRKQQQQRQSAQVNNKNHQRLFSSSALNSPSSGDSPTMDMDYDDDEEEDDGEELDVVSPVEPELFKRSLLSANQNSNKNNNNNNKSQTPQANQDLNDDQDLYIDSSVVRDFLEVNNQQQPSTSSQLSPSGYSGQSQATTVLIKFFLESSRSVVFIEVPIEHPFFVFHRGWSSWNPQRTYDKFGLKCRKLKIGDTCVSLIRKQQQQPQPPLQVQHQPLSLHPQIQHHQHQDHSDPCNILFSSIRITS